MESINERVIKFSGSSAIEEDLELGQEVSVKVVGGVVKIEYRDNQDGTCDKVAVVKLMSVENEKQGIEE